MMYKSIKYIFVMTVILLAISPVMGFDSSKYKDYGPLANPTFEDITGSAIIHTRAAGASNIIVYIKSENQNVTPADIIVNPDFSNDQEYIKAPILPDGNSEMIRLKPGIYTAYLPNGNANQLEYQSFIIGARYTTYISFIGQASSMSGGC